VSAWRSPREALLVVAKALALGAALGVAMRLAGFIRDLRLALVVNMVFAGVMWPAFELLEPWYHARDTGSETPGRMAATALVKMLALYSVLVAVCIALIRVVGGFDLLRFGGSLLFAYLFGLVITAFMNSLHTTSSLVSAERARAKAEVDRVRFELLERENERKTKELEEARALQLSMLPAEPPARTDVAIAFGMRTATEVGGDYYDVRETPDGRLELVIGDATGHGTKAGLLVVAAKTLFQTEADGSSPAAALARANRGVKSLNLTRMNMALARLSLGDAAVTLSAGGMPPALHFRAATGTVHEVTSEAPPAGQLRIARYSDSVVPFASGDRLLLFSDGFPECLDPAGAQLGYDAAREAFASVASRAPREIVDALFAATDAWAGGRAYDDDVSFLVIAKL
jgi:serine phosphatase RsbU (regulator of sigma subunit)